MKPHEEYWVTAVHEAAHAVAALPEGLSLKSITIELKRGVFSSRGVGSVWLCEPGHELETNQAPSEHRYDMYPDEMIVQAIAPYPAEYRAIRELGYGHWKARSHTREGTRQDLDHAAGYAEHASWTWNQAWAQADAIVDGQWEVIQAVAQELVDNGGYLAGLDVIDLVDGCWAGASA